MPDLGTTAVNERRRLLSSGDSKGFQLALTRDSAVGTQLFAEALVLQRSTQLATPASSTPQV